MVEKVTIMGMGHQGLAMAAHLGNHAVECFLWNRSEGHIREIQKNKEVVCKGIIEKRVKIHKVSTNLEDVLQKTIMVTTPSSAHGDLARMLAPYMDESYTIILNPGRTFGVLEFMYTLKQAGCVRVPRVAETQTIVYTCRREADNVVRIYALKEGIPIATLKREDLPIVMEAMPRCIRNYFLPVDDYLITSFGNVGMLLHCAPVIMNVGWIENKKMKFEYYYDGISESVAGVIEKIDKERIAVAKGMGVDVESLIGWLSRTYQTKGNNLFEHLQSNSYYRGIDAPKSIHHRYLEEDVPNGLVAIESAGRLLGISTPVISSIISMANLLMDCDYRKKGRDYSILRNVEDYT
jgi:opine dehydrogenase